MIHARRSRGRIALAVLATLAPVTVYAAGFDPSRMQWADKAIEKAIADKQVPGAVLLVGQGDKALYRKAYGNRSVQPAATPMTTDTIFDMASCSKVIGCATSVMLLVERGQINLSDPVSRYIPAFAANGKKAVTIEQLLLHRGGLIPDNPMSDYADGPEKAWERIWNLPLVYEPGAKFDYTDVGYIVLGELVRVVDGRPLDRFAAEEIFAPLGMNDTAYCPPERLKGRCAPTEQREGHWMIGEVHDPRAYALGGVAGHAGLFSTADDTARWCRMILGKGELDGKRVLSAMTVREMARQRCLPGGTGGRGYGFDISTGYSSARGNLFEMGSTFGHTGFTGTMFWIDPQSDSYVVFLTSRVHPDGKGEIIDLRRRVATVVAAAIIPDDTDRTPTAVIEPAVQTILAAATDAPAATRGRAATEHASGPPADVLCGIDVLKADGFKALEGRKIALITNHTGVDRDGNRLPDLLMKAGNCTLVKLFSPEHGLYGQLDETVGDTVDKQTGLKVYSLYGATRRPSAEMLEGVDTLVFDIQDIGARFYTYVATMGFAMEEAAKHNIKMVVLDRPNPITGLTVDGPIADQKRYGFTAYGPLPVAHGMTIGELAKMANTEYKVNADLTVIPCKGWKRSMWYDQTGLMWINPSPNMRNLTQATLYPAVCLLEATNVSVGRGTDQPFELFGAPWVDGRKLAAALNGANLPGLRFVPITFTPTSSKHAKKPCQGVYILVTDRRRIEHVRSGLTMAWHLKKLFGQAFEIDPVVNLLSNAEALAALKAADDPAKLPQLWQKPLADFKAIRQKYLMYP